MYFSSKNLLIIIRVLIGVFFIGSAIIKLISIDSFEVFIYGLGVLNLDLSFLAARLVLALEFFTGILLLAGVYLRVVVPATIALLALFIVFIAYIMLFDSDKHCYCFGDILEISNLWSITKNIVLIIILLMIQRTSGFMTKYKKLITITALVLCLAVPFTLSPPDTFYYKHYSQNVIYDQVLLQGFLDDNTDLQEGRRIICFFGTGCRFCKLAIQKINVIADKSEKVDRVSCIFLGKDESIKDFYRETYSHNYPYTILSPDKFIRITKGEMPLILLVENGVIKGKYGYRSINEQQFIEFLNK